MVNFLESIHSCAMCINIEIASVISEICIVCEMATTSVSGLFWPVTPTH